MDELTVALLLEEEEEDEEYLLFELRKEQHMMFTTRKEEGCFNLLINKYLMGDEKKFREYFRINKDLMHMILHHIEEDISLKEYNRVQAPISAIEKLCVTFDLYIVYC